uniref:Uncharacterized protein n=1 Tax=Anguilla anguilla TaxID=7936 RepID=A0A0E9V371_ANGAN
MAAPCILYPFVSLPGLYTSKLIS